MVGALCLLALRLTEDLVDNAVLFRLVSSEEEVTLDILLYLVEFLSGILRENAI